MSAKQATTYISKTSSPSSSIRLHKNMFDALDNNSEAESVEFNHPENKKESVESNHPENKQEAVESTSTDSPDYEELFKGFSKPNSRKVKKKMTIRRVKYCTGPSYITRRVVYIGDILCLGDEDNDSE